MVALVDGHISLLLPKIQLQIAGGQNLYKLSIKCITSRITVNAYMAISMQITYTYMRPIYIVHDSSNNNDNKRANWQD